MSDTYIQQGALVLMKFVRAPICSKWLSTLW